ncbi:fatty acid-binding protein, liver-like [Festucalex cinctus]
MLIVKVFSYFQTKKYIMVVPCCETVHQWNNRDLQVPNMPTSSATNHKHGTTRSRADMDFSGTCKVYLEENLEAFMKAMDVGVEGAPQMVIKMRKDVKPLIGFEQKGDAWIYTFKTPKFSKTHSFCIGKETEMTTVDGRKIKVIAALLAIVLREIRGEDMVEVSQDYFPALCNDF